MRIFIALLCVFSALAVASGSSAGGACCLAHSVHNCIDGQAQDLCVTKLKGTFLGAGSSCSENKCDALKAASKAPITVTGTVSEKGGSGISGATVVIFTHQRVRIGESKTGKDGAYTITVPASETAGDRLPFEIVLSEEGLTAGKGKRCARASEGASITSADIKASKNSIFKRSLVAKCGSGASAVVSRAKLAARHLEDSSSSWSSTSDELSSSYVPDDDDGGVHTPASVDDDDDHVHRRRHRGHHSGHGTLTWILIGVIAVFAIGILIWVLYVPEGAVRSKAVYTQKGKRSDDNVFS